MPGTAKYGGYKDEKKQMPFLLTVWSGRRHQTSNHKSKCEPVTLQCEGGVNQAPCLQRVQWAAWLMSGTQGREGDTQRELQLR